MHIVDRVDLLERERELAALGLLVAATASGAAGVGLIEGAAGIGKSRLLSSAREDAGSAGLRVLRARGGELERKFAFGVVRQLIEPVLVGREDVLYVGAACAARGVFDLNADADDHADPSFASMHGLYWLVVNLTADGPLLLAIDDVHWCDRASLRFLAYLVRRLEGLPVLVIATARPALQGDHGALVDEIVGDDLTVRIPLRPLSEESAGSLVRQRLGGDAAPAFSRACHAATGGNPLLLDELLKALAAEGVRPDAAHTRMVGDLGPAAVSRSVLLRLRRLPEDAVAVANAVAVLDEGAALGIVAALAGLTIKEAIRGAGDLARAEILRPGEPIAFVHPLVGAAVYGDLPPLGRALQHERAVALLVAAGAPAEQVAAHLEKVEGRGDPAAVDTLLGAARVAMHKGAPESAVNLLGRALQEPPAPAQRVAVLLELGRAEALTWGPAAASTWQRLTRCWTNHWRGRRRRRRWPGCCSSPVTRPMERRSLALRRQKFRATCKTCASRCRRSCTWPSCSALMSPTRWAAWSSTAAYRPGRASGARCWRRSLRRTGCTQAVQATRASSLPSLPSPVAS